MNKKSLLNPVTIRLKELPLEGRIYEYSNESKELTESLKDLIGTNPYSIQLEVKPLGNAFEATGFIRTQLDLVCSRCGSPFKFQVNEKIREIIIIESALPRTGQQSKVNHINELEEAAPNCTSIPTDHFNVGEFSHEIIALTEPLQPVGGSLCSEGCEDLLEKYNRGELGSQAQPDQESSPFAVLKTLKVRN